MRNPISFIILLAFFLNSLGPIPFAQADDFRLPAPGVIVHLSPPLNPSILKGIKVDPNNPFRFDFILDEGDSSLHKNMSSLNDKSMSSPNALVGDPQQEQLKSDAARLIKYFLASLTIPEKDLWVNLSPYEKNRIIPQSFGLTEMGRDLLAEDYMLKQITASLIYPEDEVGKKFWKRIYQEAQSKYGTTNIPVNTFNKVWIVPEKAVVYENTQAGTAYVVEAKLKVMLEQDYLSLQNHSAITKTPMSSPNALVGNPDTKDVNQLGSQVIREIVIPELTKEVNEDKNFSQLRQVYNSLILATWYKKKIRDSILEQVYADKNKIKGLSYKSKKDISSPNASIGDPEYIYQQYLKAFKKGVFNFIKEESSPPLDREGAGGVTVPRKYFSGGMAFNQAMTVALTTTSDLAVIAGQKFDHAQVISVVLNGESDKAMKSTKRQELLMKRNSRISRPVSISQVKIFNDRRYFVPVKNYHLYSRGKSLEQVIEGWKEEKDNSAPDFIEWKQAEQNILEEFIKDNNKGTDERKEDEEELGKDLLKVFRDPLSGSFYPIQIIEPSYIPQSSDPKEALAEFLIILSNRNQLIHCISLAKIVDSFVSARSGDKEEYLRLHQQFADTLRKILRHWSGETFNSNKQPADSAMTAQEVESRLFISNQTLPQRIKNVVKELEANGISRAEFHLLGEFLLYKVALNDSQFDLEKEQPAYADIRAFFIAIAQSGSNSKNIKDIQSLAKEYISKVEMIFRNKHQARLEFLMVAWVRSTIAEYISRALRKRSNPALPLRAPKLEINSLVKFLISKKTPTVVFKIDGQQFREPVTGTAIIQAAFGLVEEYVDKDEDEEAYTLFVLLLKILQTPNSMQGLDLQYYDMSVGTIMNIWLKKEEIEPRELFNKVQDFAARNLGIIIKEPEGDAFANWLVDWAMTTSFQERQKIGDRAQLVLSEAEREKLGVDLKAIFDSSNQITTGSVSGSLAPFLSHQHEFLPFDDVHGGIKMFGLLKELLTSNVMKTRFPKLFLKLSATRVVSVDGLKRVIDFIKIYQWTPKNIPDIHIESFKKILYEEGFIIDPDLVTKNHIMEIVSYLYQMNYVGPADNIEEKKLVSFSKRVSVFNIAPVTNGQAKTMIDFLLEQGFISLDDHDVLLRNWDGLYAIYRNIFDKHIADRDGKSGFPVVNNVKSHELKSKLWAEVREELLDKTGIEKLTQEIANIKDRYLSFRFLSSENMGPLLEKLNRPIGAFEDVESAADWLNDSIEPFKIYITHIKSNPVDPTIRNLLPPDFESFSDDQLQELARKPNGRRLKREILIHLYPQETPVRQIDKDAEIYKNEQSSHAQGDELEKLVIQYRQMRLKQELEPKESLRELLTTELVKEEKEELQEKMDTLILEYYGYTDKIDPILSEVFLKFSDLVQEADYIQEKDLREDLGEDFSLMRLKRGYYKDSKGLFQFKEESDHSNVLEIQYDGETDLNQLFTDNPTLMYKVLFEMVNRYATPSEEILKVIRERASAIQEGKAKIDLNQRKEIASIFTDILGLKKGVGSTLLMMQELGLLGLMMPDLIPLDKIFAADFHRFTTLRHIIYLQQSIDNLDLIDLDQLPADVVSIIKELKAISTGLNAPSLIISRLSILLHDAVKEENSKEFDQPHTIGAANDLVHKVLKSLNLEAIEESVSWLVWYHQELSSRGGLTPEGIPFCHRDLLDILKLGKGVLNSNLWNIFYLLSMADEMSTDPVSAINKLKANKNKVIYSIYQQLNEYFNLGDEQQKALREKWEEAAKVEDQKILDDKKIKLKESMDISLAIETLDLEPGQRERLQAFVDDQVNFEKLFKEYSHLFQPIYYRQLTNNLLAAQFVRFALVSMPSQSAKSLLSVSALFSRLHTEHGNLLEFQVFLNRDQEGIMYKIMGILAAMGINVLDARVHTTSQDHIFDTVHGYFLDNAPNPRDIAKQIKLLLEQRRVRTSTIIDENKSGWAEVLPLLFNLVVEGKISVDDVFNLDGAVKESKKLRNDNKESIKVNFDKYDVKTNGITASTLNINGPDRNGLAYILARILSQRFNLNIEIAPVDTFQMGVVDKFNVTKNDKPLTKDEKNEITRYLNVYLNWDVITSDNVRQSVRKINVVKSPANFVSFLGLPLSERERKNAIQLVKDLLSPQWPEGKYKYNREDIVEGEGVPTLRTLQLKSLERFAELVKADAAQSAPNDRAMTTPKNGGIDLTSANMDLQINSNGQRIKFHLDPAQLAQLKNTSGFTPVIINIQPLNSLQQFLGINTTKNLHV